MSRHLSKFGGPRPYGSGDITVLVCHMISKDHMIQGSCDFIGGIPSWNVTILLCLVVMGTGLVKI